MRILIRTDGDAHIGAGHVMRMLALAQHARLQGHQVGFVCLRLAAGLARRLADEGFAVAHSEVEPGSRDDLAFTVACAERADWVVADGYDLDVAFQDGIRAAGLRLLFVDDLGRCPRVAAELVLDAGPSASAEMYPHDPARTRLLLGPAYALLRREIVAGGGARSPPQRAEHVLVTMGGADPSGATERVLAALEGVPEGPSVRAIVGPGDPRGDVLSARTSPRVTLVRSPADMAAEMCWAHVAIAGAGVTALELAYLGVPSILVVVADNQLGTARGMLRLGACAAVLEVLDGARLAELVSSLCADEARRRGIAERARAVVDGRGAERVLAAMTGGAA